MAGAKAAAFGKLIIDTSGTSFTGVSPRAPSRDPAEIIPNLFIGSLLAANNADRLREHHIRAVLNASRCEYALPEGISGLRVEVEDTLDSNLRSHFDTTNTWIHELRKAGGAVLVHCQAGISRSSTLVIAYLLFSGLKPTLQEAYRHCVSQKSNVQPNESFFRQLQAYEQELHGCVTMSMLDYYRDSFVSMGYSKLEVEQVCKTAGTDDYHQLVHLLTSRSSRPNSGLRCIPASPSMQV